MEDFTGFETIKGLKTGDFREKAHFVGINETAESIMSNEVVCWIQCGDDVIAFKNFSRRREPDELKNWVNVVLEAHKPECQL